ncbi:putative olfactory receptor 7A2 [Genypterus blacodes]|uniref:putative olfactory receptor 7A2 n=1 Tax=Genypterus blacodes TaxID=154954 RepID=UPI003F760A2F
MENTSEFVFVLQGLNDSLTNRQLYFALTLFSYLFTVFVNLTLIVTILLDKTLHEPMYIFLCNLCFNSILGASSFYPKMLYDLLADRQVISYSGCLSQICVIYSYVFCEYTSLTVMAYDRYVAICRPLQYGAVMTPQKVVLLLLLTWSFSLLESLVGVALTARLPLCDYHVPKIFCTNWVVVKLSCTSTIVNNIYGYLITFSHLSQTCLILVSYARLVHVSLQSLSIRRKFVQTCVPHLVTLLVFTASLLFDLMYARYGSSAGGSGSGSLLTVQNILAAEFLVVPPLVNPIIYGMNLQQIRSRISHSFKTERQNSM